MENFRAGVQYNDWSGTVAADDDDQSDLEAHLKGEGLIEQGDFLIGASLWVGENCGGRLGATYVRAFLYPKSGGARATVESALAASNGPIQVRVVDLELTPEQFIGLFKRFELVLTRRGLDLAGREYQALDD